MGSVEARFLIAPSCVEMPKSALQPSAMLLTKRTDVCPTSSPSAIDCTSPSRPVPWCDATAQSPARGLLLYGSRGPVAVSADGSGTA